MDSITLYKLKKKNNCARCGKYRSLYSPKKGGCGNDSTLTADWTYRNICRMCVTDFHTQYNTVKIGR